MKKIKFLVLILLLQSWIFYNVLSTTPIQSETSNPEETRFSVKTSSNEAFSRFLNETQVNNYTQNIQSNPSICALSSNTFAVAWESEGQDEVGGYGVYASVFDVKTGNNITKEFRANHYTTDSQKNPSICALSSDTLVIAWESEGQDEVGGYGVYARVFNATTGNNITREFQVNHNETNTQWIPSICALSSDTFAVAWESYGQDKDSWGVYASVFNATTGNNITREFRVNHYTPDNQRFPYICKLSSDTFAVTWESYLHQDGSGSGVYARVFNATTGNNITREFQVNQYWLNTQEYPSICALSSDTLAVAWRTYGQDGESGGIYARVFNATTGNAVTNEFQVNYYWSDDQNYPSICRLSSDSFAVAWGSEEQDEAPGYGVYAIAIDATTGNNITNEFQVNNYTQNNQNYPSLCPLSSNSFAVAWESMGQDSGTTGVYVSVFGDPSTSLPSSPAAPAADDDDDDDDDEFKLLIPLIIIIGIGSVFIIIGIMIYLIKKKGR